MQTIWNIVVFVLVLGSIIFIHELGHFIAAKTFGVFCSEFSLGMGPSIYHKKVGETTYHLRALPIGGYVAMAGEADQEDNEEMKDVPFERTLKGVATFKQVIIMAAGVFMNFVLAFVILFTVLSTNYQMAVDNNVIGGVVEESEAMRVGLQADDQLQSLTYVTSNQTFEIVNREDLYNALDIKNNNGLETADAVLIYTRDGQEHSVELHLPLNEDKTAYFLGVSAKLRSLTIGEAFVQTLSTIKEMSLMIFNTLGKLVTDSKNTISQLSGPAGIYQVTSEVTEAKEYGTLFILVATLSINIGIFNLLPIPGLDGSQILFALIEKAMGKEIPTKIRYYIQLAGLILVFGLMIVVTIQDITKFF